MGQRNEKTYRLAAAPGAHSHRATDAKDKCLLIGEVFLEGGYFFFLPKAGSNYGFGLAETNA